MCLEIMAHLVIISERRLLGGGAGIPGCWSGHLSLYSVQRKIWLHPGTMASSLLLSQHSVVS